MSPFITFITENTNDYHNSFTIDALYSLLKKKTTEGKCTNVKEWKPYIKCLEDTIVVTKAAIFCHNNHTVYAKIAESMECHVTLEEAKEFFDMFSANESAGRTGFSVNGRKYITVSTGHDELLGVRGSSGVVICKTLRLIIIGFFNGARLAGQCNTMVHKLADFFKQHDY
jgi:hypothetical protein